MADFTQFICGSDFAVGHNIFAHDLRYVGTTLKDAGVTQFIDTLVFSPLLFPSKPYHKLVKDYKLDTDEVNNPVNDSRLARELFDAEVDAFRSLDERFKRIYYALLGEQRAFKDFFSYLGFEANIANVGDEIRAHFDGTLCRNAPIEAMTAKYPIESAYALALISTGDKYSLTPPWVLKAYPRVENVLYFLRGRRCLQGCRYCEQFTGETAGLQEFFGYKTFRSFAGEQLQQKAVRAALDNKSLLALFPTGGGKSITFQVPALMAYRSVKGLTVVISPLQSLMKDQVDNLAGSGITEAATLNGQLSSIETANERRRIEDGEVALLYISPESLRSKSIETVLLKRNIVRFVIDEAHCFSVWGQTFRVDYQYIGDFIKNYQVQKGMTTNIPISCFTATAKQQVVSDISAYFKEKLNIELELFAARQARTNLAYHVILAEEGEKFEKLVLLLEGNEKPAIIYVSRTRKAEALADKLNNHGYRALPYHGQMENDTKIKNQEAFMSDAVRVIVATTAFGMGVDKKDVGLVIHYTISDSLENYVQEAGRAGRDERLQADCFILFNDEDLNKHFVMLNQTKVSAKEIQQIWRALAKATKTRTHACLSSLDIAREAGWSDAEVDIETRVKTAVSELEQAGFVRRGQNKSTIYADSIVVQNMQEAAEKIESAKLFESKDGEHAKRIIKSLISARSSSKGVGGEAESRIDYISDNLGIARGDVIRIVTGLRLANVLADAKDFTVYLKNGNPAASIKSLLKYRNLEKALIAAVAETATELNIKAFFEKTERVINGISINEIKLLLNYLKIKKLLHYHYKAHGVQYTRADYIIVKALISREQLLQQAEKRWRAASEILRYLHSKYQPGNAENRLMFSRIELIANHQNDLFPDSISVEEIDDVLFYLLKIGSLKIDGEFLVSYNRMLVERTADTKEKYKNEQYQHLARHYQSRTEQIHIVGEYARKVLESDEAAAEFVDDYFFMENKFFMHKYFAGRLDEIKRNMTTAKYTKLFGALSKKQLEIINDKKSKYIVVAAGPGSGKTKLLTHKLASLYIAEDLKHEQMLMLTFSRAAVTVFKKQLMGLIGSAAHYITITTFYSYCFDLLGRVGALDKTGTVIQSTIAAIKNNAVDQNKMGKLVLLIDEAQDLSGEEFELITLLMRHNDTMRVIAVGDDDQCIYEFRGASPRYLKSLAARRETACYELLDNYRSRKNIVALANAFIEKLPERLKKHPIAAKNQEQGRVRLCKHSAAELLVPLVNSVIENSLGGTSCVLARTNDEVLQIGTLLMKREISVKYVNDNNKISIGDLAELRSFCAYLRLDETPSLIDLDEWNKAKQHLARSFARSEILTDCLCALSDFEETNGKYLYKNDFLLYLREARLENFTRADSADVLVSTIHQAKGREFDHVFIALSNYHYPLKDEDRRAIYVAVTRAKSNLFVHYNGSVFDDISADGIETSIDNSVYAAPSELAHQMSYKDVVLDAFFDYQNGIDGIVAGAALSIDDKGCLFNQKRILLFSNAMKAEIAQRKQKGYLPSYAKVSVVVYWKKKADDARLLHAGMETKIVLPVIYFSNRRINRLNDEDHPAP
ncbi:RecQ family ATP-dependent DNA helicase [Breznakiellaceae bacterium SP9]